MINMNARTRRNGQLRNQSSKEEGREEKKREEEGRANGWTGMKDA